MRFANSWPQGENGSPDFASVVAALLLGTRSGLAPFGVASVFQDEGRRTKDRGGVGSLEVYECRKKDAVS